MTDKKQLIINEYTDRLLELINNYDEITISDLQGAIEVIVSIIVTKAMILQLDKDMEDLKVLKEEI